MDLKKSAICLLFTRTTSYRIELSRPRAFIAVSKEFFKICVILPLGRYREYSRSILQERAHMAETFIGGGRIRGNLLSKELTS